MRISLISGEFENFYSYTYSPLVILLYFYFSISNTAR